MDYPNTIKELGLELTDRCQASCPMCLRNYFGGSEREFIKNTEITLDNFKEWFPPVFLSNLNNMFACGNLGDPVIAKDCLAIFQYVRSINPNCRLAIHTNGSLRTPKWWKELASALSPNGEVIFGIDGFKGQHELYRKGTNWDKIIENVRAFIEAGGIAKADTIVFKHNENSIYDLKDYLLEIGFAGVNIISTERFYGQDHFPVNDLKGNHLYNLEPSTKPEWQKVFVKEHLVKLIEKTHYDTMIATTEINPRCATNFSIYVDARGRAFPCPWAVDRADMNLPMHDDNLTIMRGRMLESTHSLMETIGIVDLHSTNIIDALIENNWNEKLPQQWINNKPLMCVKNCGIKS